MNRRSFDGSWRIAAVLIVGLMSASAQRGDAAEGEQELLGIEHLRATVTRFTPDWAGVFFSDDPRVREIFNGEEQVCIFVTGVYSHDDQIDRLANDVGLDSASVAAEAKLIDFQLERQVLTADADERTAQWSTVETNLIREVLNHSSALEEEVLPEKQRDSAILMPLPRLRRGAWGEEVSHPGLFDLQSPADSAGRPLKRPAVQTRNVLLFRCADFDVRSGQRYRYRVRLEIQNPLLKGVPDELTTIKTPWTQTEFIALPTQ